MLVQNKPQTRAYASLWDAKICVEIKLGLVVFCAVEMRQIDQSSNNCLINYRGQPIQIQIFFLSFVLSFSSIVLVQTAQHGDTKVLSPIPMDCMNFKKCELECNVVLECPAKYINVNVKGDRFRDMTFPNMNTACIMQVSLHAKMCLQ